MLMQLMERTTGYEIMWMRASDNRRGFPTDWTLTETALRAGLSDMAEPLAERLPLRPHSPANLAFRNLVCKAGGPLNDPPSPLAPS
jgi:hypothetical protein